MAASRTVAAHQGKSGLRWPRRSRLEDVDGALDSLEFGGSDDGPGDMLNGETDADYYLTFLSDLIKVSTEKKAPNSFRSMP